MVLLSLHEAVLSLSSRAGGRGTARASHNETVLAVRHVAACDHNAVAIQSLSLKSWWLGSSVEWLC